MYLNGRNNHQITDSCSNAAQPASLVEAPFEAVLSIGEQRITCGNRTIFEQFVAGEMRLQSSM